ncbi:MAG: hypothetical protein HY898_13885 [Deltaproteobacteria bacterium]|nr:hypothetical protein [Deltaproteobacteria bacterium]
MLSTCPHCNVELLAWQTPAETSWDSPVLQICFNDDCPYFQRSGEWMKSHYNVAAMYRFRLDPSSGQSGPIPVWSREALRDGILSPESIPQTEPTA